MARDAFKPVPSLLSLVLVIKEKHPGLEMRRRLESLNRCPSAAANEMILLAMVVNSDII